MAASVTGLMMAATVSSMAVLAGLCAACNTAGVVCMAAHVRASRDTAGVVCMAAHVCAACNTAGVVRMAAHVRAPRNTAGIMGVAAHVRASRNAAGIVCMAAHVCAPRQTAVMIPMAIVSGVRIAVHPVVHVNFCLGTSRNAAFFVAVFACHGTAVDAAGPVCMNGLQAAPRQTGVLYERFPGCTPANRSYDTHGRRHRCADSSTPHHACALPFRYIPQCCICRGCARL